MNSRELRKGIPSEIISSMSREVVVISPTFFDGIDWDDVSWIVQIAIRRALIQLQQHQVTAPPSPPATLSPSPAPAPIPLRPLISVPPRLDEPRFRWQSRYFAQFDKENKQPIPPQSKRTSTRRRSTSPYAPRRRPFCYRC